MRRMRELRNALAGAVAACFVATGAAEAGCDQAQAAASLLRVQSAGAFSKREVVNGRIAYYWSDSYKQPNRLMTSLLVSDAEACLSPGQPLVVEFYMPDGTLFARSTPTGTSPVAMK